MDELSRQPDQGAELRRAAAQRIRVHVRQALREAAEELEHPPGQMEMETLEDAVCRSLGDRSVAWALSVAAGVAMAPDLRKLLGESP